MNSQPVLTNINNNSIDAKGGMPLKPSNADGTASFINSRKTGTAIINTPKKKFFGASNKDASSLIAKKTAITTGKQMTTTIQTNAPLASVNKKDVYDALSRARNKGCTVPLKAQSERRILPTAPTITGGETDIGQLIIYFEEGMNNKFPIENHAYSLNGGKFILFDPVSTSSPLYITSGLANGTTYTIQIASVSYYGIGALSNTITLTTFDVPAAPTNLSVTSFNDTTATIAFTAGSNGGTGILNYSYKLNGGAWNAISPSDAVSPVTITGLTQSTYYSILLRAVNAVGPGAASSAVTLTTTLSATVPAAPTNLSVVNGNTVASISFTAGSNGGSAITNYKYSIDNGEWIEVSPSDTTSPITITGLTNNITYSIRIRAINNVGDGAISNAISVTPIDPTAPVINKLLSDDGQAYIYFTNTTGATDIEYTINDGANWTSLSGTDQPLAATGLTNDILYTIKIRANTLGGYSPISNAETVTPTAGTVQTASLYYDADNYTSGALTNAGNFGTMNGTLSNVTKTTENSTGNSISIFSFTGTSAIIFGQYNFGAVFAISAWVYPLYKFSINAILTNVGANQAPSGFKVGWNNWNSANLTMLGEYGNGTEGGADATLNNTVVLNTWQYLTYMIDRTNRNIVYLKNGVPVKTASYSDNLIPANIGVNNANFRIGTFTDGSYGMNGYLKYIKVFSTGLTVAQIKADFDASKATFGL